MSSKVPNPPPQSSQRQQSPNRPRSLSQPKPPPQADPKPKPTKAERRELQEKQRAAKAAAKPNGQAAPSGATPGKPAAETSSKPPPKPQAGPPSPRISKISREDVIRAETSAASQRTAVPSEIQNPIRDLRIFSHFAIPPSGGFPNGITVKGEIHPAVLRLALQFSTFKIVGANARCIATLTAFKTVIQDYATPTGTTLSRHLSAHLSPQITYLVQARPMAASMGNAIRNLKYEISILSIDLPEQDAKDFLCQRIDDYIRDKILLADQVIQELAIEKIKNGDTVLTYARSSVVENLLLGAHEQGRRFSVVVVDSLPLLEGKHLLSSLTNAGIPCTYCLLPALDTVLSTVSLVFVGTQALHSNGSLYSRAGTALVAMMAKEKSVPVLVCCETYKFSDAIPFDGFTKNELAPVLSPYPHSNLQIINPLYDLTPPTLLTAVVTEVGLIPPSSVPTVLLRAGAQEIQNL